MRLIFFILLFFSFSIANRVAGQQRRGAEQQRITLKFIDGGIAITYLKDGKDADASQLDTRRNITISVDSALSLNTVEIKDSTGTIIGPERYNPASKVIMGNTDWPTYQITFKVTGHPDTTIKELGKDKTIAEGNSATNGNIELNPSRCDCSSGGDTDPALRAAFELCPGCNDDNVVVYDAKCQSFYAVVDKEKDTKTGDKGLRKITNLRDLKFKYREGFKVKIIHVNRYINDIKITADDSVYSSQAPALFNEIFGGSGTLMTGLIGKIPTQSGDNKSTEQQKLDAFYKRLIAFIRTLNNLQEQRDNMFDLCCEASALCSNRKSSATFSNLSMRVIELQMEYNEIRNEFQKSLEKRTALNAEVEKLQKEKDAAKTKKDKARLEVLLIGKKKDRDAIPTNLQTLKDQMEAWWTAFEKPSADLLRSLALFNQNYLKDNFVFSTPMIFPQGNRMKLSIKVDTRDTFHVIKTGGRVPEHQEQLVEGPILKKWFISFSNGPFLGFDENLKETAYEFVRVPSFGTTINDTSKYELKAAGETDAPLGLAALAHFQRKFSNGLGYGLALGVGLTIEKKPKLFYLLGPSLFLGDQQQFTISAGFAATQMDVLRKELYTEGLKYNAAPDLKYRKDLRLGGFISLTYTIFTVSKRN